MINNDLVLAKISSIDRCLKRIETTTQGDPKKLKNFDIQDVFVLNLQRAIQISIDLASHLVSAQNLGVPKTLRESFELLEKANVLESSLAKRLSKMVGFRNIAIHEYQLINEEILESIFTERLGDLKEFIAAISQLITKNEQI